ncbi:MAG: HEAT repeat domain-containing protein, partial [Sandaracinaceae bacterium]|nr:HEAT repeat domain-containing protein [Sandaracinaceae bacterium]
SDDQEWEEGSEDEPELVLDAGDDEEPELFEEPGEPPPPSLASPRQKPAGTYRLRGGAVDIVAEGDRHLHGEGPLRAEVVHIPASRPARDQDAETRSVIVDMGEQVHAQVEDLLHAQDDRQRDELISGLRAFGEAALPVLVQAFPGPLSFERHQSRRRLPAGRDVSPIARALVAFGERAVPYVASLLTSASSDTRYYASLVAAELVHPGLLEVVAERIHDEDDDTRKIACLLLPRFRGMSGFDEILAVIRRTARLRGKHLERRHHAVDALAALRDASSAESLAELLREDDPELVRRVHRALVLITGTDEGTSPRKWLAWLKRHGGRHRIEWLIEALTHPDEPVRAAAGDELKRLTQEYYGFHAGSPRRDRELVQQRYRRWWEKDGHKRFGL